MDLAAGEIALYTTHHAACRIDAGHYTSLVMSLKPSSTNENGILHQYLGEPILRWSEQESRSPVFERQAHAVLSAWVSMEQVHYPLRSIKTTETVHWKTNELPQRGGAVLLEAVGFSLHARWLEQHGASTLGYLAQILAGRLALAGGRKTPEQGQ